MNRLFRYLLQGLLYIAPISITIYIVYLVFTFTDGLLQKWIHQIFNIEVPGLGVVIILVLLILIGFFGQTIIAKPIKNLGNHLLNRAPLVKVIYSAINDLFSAFVGKEKKFNKPVLVKTNLNSDLEKLGFLTAEDLTILGEKDKVAVYFPHSYNFSGEMFIVPREHVKPIDLPPAEVMKFIVSAGVSDWEKLK